MKSLNAPQSWYESSLPRAERKRRGHFSTPPRLVEQILDACGYVPVRDLTNVRVLDPACGDGNFLVAAARRLLTFAQQQSLDQEAVIQLLQRNIWGFDPDPIACFISEMRLQALLNEGISTAVLADVSIPSPREVGLNEDVGADVSCPPPIDRPLPALRIRQADSLALPWEPCIDLFVANPPYLAAKNTDLSGYQHARRGGQGDSYLLFLRLALQAVRPNGWMGLVLPDPILARANAARERASLLKETTIHHIWHLSGVFAADVGAVVIIAQKRLAQSIHQVAWIRAKWEGGIHRKDGLAGHCPQGLFQRQPGAELRYLLSGEHDTIVEKLCACLDEGQNVAQHFAPLAQFMTISRGEELGKDNPAIIDGLAGADTSAMPTINRGLRSGETSRGGEESEMAAINEDVQTTGFQDGSYYPVLLGGSDIRPYKIPYATHFIARGAVAKPVQRYLAPKLLVVKSTDRLQAALDLQGNVVLQTLYLLRLRHTDSEEDDLYFFLGLLNSRLLSRYVYVLHTAYKWVQPQIEQSVLARLPIPIIEAPEQRQHIIRLARLLVKAHNTLLPNLESSEHSAALYEELEQIICALYKQL